MSNDFVLAASTFKLEHVHVTESTVRVDVRWVRILREEPNRLIVHQIQRLIIDRVKPLLIDYAHRLNAFGEVGGSVRVVVHSNRIVPIAVEERISILARERCCSFFHKRVKFKTRVLRERCTGTR